MINFFRKIRQQILIENKFSKYLIYAIGEISLVVIGILIALQLNNQNELRKQKLVEIDILEGIRNDILQDTIDISSNIKFYNSNNKNYDFFINELINKKKQSRDIKLFLINLTVSDRTLVLYDSHFQEAKIKGLYIISNKILKGKISRLYEWNYENLLLTENYFDLYNSSKILNNELGKYFGLDSTGMIHISKSNYDRLLSNNNVLYHIKRWHVLEGQLLRKHQETMKVALNVVESINKELIELKK